MTYNLLAQAQPSKGSGTHLKLGVALSFISGIVWFLNGIFIASGIAIILAILIIAFTYMGYSGTGLSFPVREGAPALSVEQRTRALNGFLVFIIGWIAIIVTSFSSLFGILWSFLAVVGGMLIMLAGNLPSVRAKTAAPTATEVHPETTKTVTSENIPVHPPVEASPIVYCGYCGFKNDKDSAYCQKCGRNLTGGITAEAGPTEKFCANCGTKNKSEAIFCKNCGKQLS